MSRDEVSVLPRQEEHEPGSLKAQFQRKFSSAVTTEPTENRCIFYFYFYFEFSPRACCRLIFHVRPLVQRHQSSVHRSICGDSLDCQNAAIEMLPLVPSPLQRYLLYCIGFAQGRCSYSNRLFGLHMAGVIPFLGDLQRGFGNVFRVAFIVVAEAKLQEALDRPTYIHDTSSRLVCGGCNVFICGCHYMKGIFQ